MPTKSLFNTSGSYEVKTNRNGRALEMTIILDKNWAKQLGLPTNRFFIQEPISDMAQHEHWLEEKLWSNIREAARSQKITDYYYPEDAYQKH